MSKVVIVGGGAAGMFASIAAADADIRLCYMRRMKSLGKNCILQEKEDAI